MSRYRPPTEFQKDLMYFLRHGSNVNQMVEECGVKRSIVVNNLIQLIRHGHISIFDLISNTEFKAIRRNMLSDLWKNKEEYFFVDAHKHYLYDYNQLIKIMSDNGIKLLYHFSAIQNYPTIKTHGLLSRRLCFENHLKILPASTELSRKLDRESEVGYYRSDNYIRLSFHNQHPMIHAIKERSPDLKLIMFEILLDILNTEEAKEKRVYFSTLNAASSAATIKPGVQGLKEINLPFQRLAQTKKMPMQMKELQAEILFPDKIEFKYILNGTII